MSQDKHLPAKEFYEYTVHQIEQEQGLVDTRISWTLTFEGFLFAAIAIGVSESTPSGVRVVFQYIIPLIGIAVALLALVGVYASALSKDVIKRGWMQHPSFALYPPTFGGRKISILGRITSYGIPIALIVAWLLFLICFIFIP